MQTREYNAPHLPRHTRCAACTPADMIFSRTSTPGLISSPDGPSHALASSFNTNSLGMFCTGPGTNDGTRANERRERSPWSRLLADGSVTRQVCAHTHGRHRLPLAIQRCSMDQPRRKSPAVSEDTREDRQRPAAAVENHRAPHKRTNAASVHVCQPPPPTPPLTAVTCDTVESRISFLNGFIMMALYVMSNRT